MNMIEQLFNDFGTKHLEEAKKNGVDLGLQTVFTPIDKIEKATGFRFADHINKNTKSVGILFNYEFLYYFVKELQDDYINNIKFTFFYDCEFDYKQVKNCIFFSGKKLNIEMVYIENIKDLDKVMVGKKFDIDPVTLGLYNDFGLLNLTGNQIIKIPRSSKYIVKQDDTVESILSKTNRSAEDLLRSNSSSWLKAGSKIVL